MNKKEKVENAVAHIYLDYKAILNFVMTCLNNKLDYSSYMGVMPFFCLYVVEGYEYLCKNEIIPPDCITKNQLTKLKKCRAVGVKLHSEFKQTTFDSINTFNRNEYIKFYKKAFPDSTPRLLSIVDNYFICCVDDYPVGNYHLYSKKVFDMEIGSYIPDITQRVYELAYLLAGFSIRIVEAIDKSFDKSKIGTRSVQMKFDYADLNMAYDYPNFSIKQAPPILMAFLDVLCVINSYRKIFVAINEDNVFDLKVKYSLLFYVILSLKSIVAYSEENFFDIQMEDEFKIYISDLDAKYVNNNLRKHCMHYDYPVDAWIEDPFTEVFEKTFGKTLKEISEELSMVIDNLANKLQKYLIVKNFYYKPID